MEKTLASMRRHVAIVGDTNTGKSTLFNALTGQENAIVSPECGTTTDPVQKTMELIPFGPIVLIDTAGFSDDSGLGKARMKKSGDILRRCDAVIYALDATGPADDAYAEFSKMKMPHLLVLTKCDMLSQRDFEALTEKYPAAVPVFEGDVASASAVRGKLSELLSSLEPRERPLLGDLVSAGGTVLLVTPIDSAAPKGRLILPQVQAIRDCLDNGIFCAVTQVSGLAAALEKLGGADLVVTDSQAFAEVNPIVPGHIPLTSFSMLLARQKGDFAANLKGAKAAGSLGDKAKILILEGCTHNRTHEDIGRVKIPAMLRKKTGMDLDFDFAGGYDFPQDLSRYALAVQCGGCMLSQAEIDNRCDLLENSGVPYTNYGVLLAWGAGILDRCAGIFEGKI